MNINELTNKIIKEHYCPQKLIFYGEEEYLQKSIIKLISKTFNLDYHYYNDYEDIKESLFTNDFFDEGQIYIIRESKYFIKNKLAFKELNIPKKKVLILIYEEIDTKKDLFSQNQDFLYEFHKLSKYKLEIFINQYFNDLEDINKYNLCSMVNDDCQRLFSELEKLNILNKTMSFKNSNELFDFAINDGLIYKENNETLFQLANAIMNNNLIDAFKINKKLEKSQDDIFKLINKLYEDLKNKLNDNNFNKLIKKLFFLQELEKNIKIGKIENDFAYDYLIINLGKE